LSVVVGEACSTQFYWNQMALCLVIRGWSSHAEWCFGGYVGRASLALSHGINGRVWYL
jgi:hypothetical protein